jgi:hypothetical protein
MSVALIRHPVAGEAMIRVVDFKGMMPRKEHRGLVLQVPEQKQLGLCRMRTDA